MRVTVSHGGDHLDETLRRGGFRYRAAMLTLTYRDLDGWRPDHLAQLQAHVRNWLKRRGVRYGYVWVAELQQRGAVHYHLVLWLPKGLTLPKPDKQGWWPHGMTRIEWARKPIGYLLKYASKGAPGLTFPKGLRLYGTSRLAEVPRRICRYWKTPRYAREALTGQGMEGPGDVIRAPGGGFVDRLTGLFWSWRLEGEPHGLPG
jgi:hypothetical protein